VEEIEDFFTVSLSLLADRHVLWRIKVSKLIKCALSPMQSNNQRHPHSINMFLETVPDRAIWTLFLRCVWVFYFKILRIYQNN